MPFTQKGGATFVTPPLLVGENVVRRRRAEPAEA
jgi:hypothetical protein